MLEILACLIMWLCDLYESMVVADNAKWAGNQSKREETSKKFRSVGQIHSGVQVSNILIIWLMGIMMMLAMEIEK